MEDKHFYIMWKGKKMSKNNNIKREIIENIK